MSTTTNLVLALMLVAAPLGAAPRDAQDNLAPEDFRALDHIDPMIERVLVALPLELEVDLERGLRSRSCPVGLNRGRLRVSVDGDAWFTYIGELFGCLPFGHGEIEYADGSRYVGTVNSYLAGDVVPDRLDLDSARLAVREGEGRFITRAGRDEQALFSRGARVKDGEADRRVQRFRTRLAELDAARGTAGSRGATGVAPPSVPGVGSPPGRATPGQPAPPSIPVPVVPRR